MTSNRLFFLHEQNDEPIGSKARNLQLLLSAGFPVPPGFVVTAKHENLSDSELDAAIEKLGGFPVAVRSSAEAEDLAGASFAGQYQTFLNVESLSGLRAAIQKCFASAESEQVLAYRKSKSIEEAGAMAVLVQKMVNATVAGVGFSLHPMTGNDRHAYIECCEGLGEKLVSGHVQPTSYCMDLETAKILEFRLGSEKAALDEKFLLELRDCLLEVQAYFHRPQDIEWAIDTAGKFWLLQARPITKIQWRSDIEEYTNADFKDGGVSARVCTPLMFSLYRDAMQVSMPGYMKTIRLLGKKAKVETFIDWFYGRPYWNASAVKRVLKKVPGFDEEAFDRDLGIQKKYGSKGPVKIPMNLRTILPAIPVAIALERDYQKQLRDCANYGKRFLALEKTYLDLVKDFSHMDDGEFSSHFQKVLRLQQETESDYFTAIYANSNYQSDFKKLVEKLAKKLSLSLSPLDLMGGLEDISHLESQKGFFRLHSIAKDFDFSSGEWKFALREFLDKNYFHGDAELDLLQPRWGETPERIQEIVAGFIRSGSVPRDPEETSKVQREAFETKLALIYAKMSKRKLLKVRSQKQFAKKLEVSRNFLRLREEMREYSTRAYYLIRIYALELGRRWKAAQLLERVDDVFMLLVEELSAPSKAKAAAHFHRLMYEGYRDLVPPDELGRGVEQRSTDSYWEKVGDRNVLRGVGCSPGSTEGTARVIRSLGDAGSLGENDILVTRFTDPGWTPVLGMVKGVVTEVGGMLSHAAVIGREYGIPAVLNLQGATGAIKDGQRIRIDGATGIVELL